MTLQWIEQSGVQEEYNFLANWYDPANADLIVLPLPVYHCPSANFGRTATSQSPAFGVRTAAAWDYGSVNVSSYVPGYSGSANADRRKGVMNDREASTIADTSNYPAGLVGPGETTGGVWAEHQKAVSVGGASGNGTTTLGGGPCAINCTNDWEIYAMHPAGANGVFADGSVRFLGATMPITILGALYSRAGYDETGSD